MGLGKIPPPQGSPKTKVVDGKTYHRCVNHQAWTVNTEAECTFKPDATLNPSNSRNNFQRALTTVIETITDSDEE